MKTRRTRRDGSSVSLCARIALREGTSRRFRRRNANWGARAHPGYAIGSSEWLCPLGQRPAAEKIAAPHEEARRPQIGTRCSRNRPLQTVPQFHVRHGACDHESGCQRRADVRSPGARHLPKPLRIHPDHHRADNEPLPPKSSGGAARPTGQAGSIVSRRGIIACVSRSRPQSGTGAGNRTSKRVRPFAEKA